MVIDPIHESCAQGCCLIKMLRKTCFSKCQQSVCARLGRPFMDHRLNVI